MIDSFMGSYRWLSNFWMCSITYEGVAYPSTEHAFQAAKSLDYNERLRFAEVSPAFATRPNMTCAEAKCAGRALKIRPDWEQVKVNVMRAVLREKFKHVDLARKLLDTGNEVLVEGNTWGDRVWGQCPVGVGENWLGRLLMEIREELRQTSTNAPTKCPQCGQNSVRAKTLQSGGGEACQNCSYWFCY